MSVKESCPKDPDLGRVSECNDRNTKRVQLAASTPLATPTDISRVAAINPITGIGTNEVHRIKPQNAKGVYARFLGENPRHLNEPVCQIRPSEGDYSVRDCLSWKQEYQRLDNQGKQHSNMLV